MCLGIPGRVVAVLDGGELAQVDVAGLVREIHLGLLDEPVAPGDYILIHTGFALERMTEQQAHEALAALADGDLMAGA